VFIHPEQHSPEQDNFKITEFFGEFENVVRAKSGNKELEIRELLLYGRKVEAGWPATHRWQHDPTDFPSDPRDQMELLAECHQWWNQDPNGGEALAVAGQGRGPGRSRVP
jgi:hypothetical protein